MKKHIFYCPNCEKQEMRKEKRQWCDCSNPPFEMAWHTKEEDEALKRRVGQLMGALGGNATAKKYGAKHFSEAGKKGMAKRWGDKKQSLR